MNQFVENAFRGILAVQLYRRFWPEDVPAVLDSLGAEPSTEHLGPRPVDEALMARIAARTQARQQ